MSVGGAGEPCGYPKEIFEVVDPKYLCGRCSSILKQPLQSFCGHRFCRDCFQFQLEYCKDNLTCSQCVAEDTVTEYSILNPEQTFPDNALKREFLKLLSRCQYPGCTWSGPFKDFEGHYTSCEFIPKQEPEQVSISKKFEDIRKRITSTEQFVEQLSNRIGQVEHQISSGKASTSVETSVVPASSSGGAAAVTEVFSAISPQQHQQIKEVQKNTGILETILTVLGRELEQYSEQTSANDREDRLLRDKAGTVDRKSVEVEQSMQVKDGMVVNLEKKITALDQTSYDGTLFWKISGFNEKRHEAVSGRVASFYSPPFYTSKTGYKMCARIYLNGDGMGKGTHVSLFFVVMRSPYDALLKWPFRQKVTLMFLDQNGRENVTDSFRPDPTSSSFKRPTTEMNIASGCPLFMPLSTLDSPTIAYVRENTAFVKIVVNLDGLG